MIVEKLAEVGSLDHFEERQLNALASVMTQKTFDEGDTILHQGSLSDGIYIVLSGIIQVSRVTASGAILVLGELDEGVLFGTLSAIDQGVRGANCIAKSSVEVACIPLGAFQDLLAGKSSLALHLQAAVLRSVFDDLRATNKQLAELLALEPYFIMKSV